MCLKSFVFLLVFLVLSVTGVHAQRKDNIPNDQLLSNKLKIVDSLYQKYATHRFRPKKESITAYGWFGEPIKLSNNPLVTNIYIRKGTHAGITGLWLDCTISNGNVSKISSSYYIPMKYMVDVESEPVASEKKEREQLQKARVTDAPLISQDTKEALLFGGIVCVLFIAFILLGVAIDGKNAFANSTNNKPKDEMFFGDGGMKWGKRNITGGYTDSLGKNYRPKGFGSYESKK